MARHSCLNAMQKIPPWTQPVIFGGRTVDIKDVVVPLRYLSDDGLCAFDVTLMRANSGDVANGLGLLHAARRIWETCGIDAAVGGSTSGFSK